MPTADFANHIQRFDMWLMFISWLNLVEVAFFDNRQRYAQFFSEIPGAFGKPHIWRNHRQILDAPLAKVVHHHRHGAQFIDRNRKKSLNLAGMQIERNHLLGTCNLNHIGEQARRNRHPRLVAFVSPPIGKER